MSDLINRQDALDAIDERVQFLKDDPVFRRKHGDIDLYGIKPIIRALPSAQPEVIRCTECKHYREYDSEYVENAVVVQCMADRYPISETIPDGWFCAGAERKDDE